VKYDENWWEMLNNDGNMVRHDEQWWDMVRNDGKWWNMVNGMSNGNWMVKYGNGSKLGTPTRLTSVVPFWSSILTHTHMMKTDKKWWKTMRHGEKWWKMMETWWKKWWNWWTHYEDRWKPDESMVEHAGFTIEVMDIHEAIKVIEFLNFNHVYWFLHEH
jgi:hypothetical protein